MNTFSVVQPDVKAKQYYASAPDAWPRWVAPVILPSTTLPTTRWQIVATLHRGTFGAMSGATPPMLHWTQTRTAATRRASGRVAKAIQTGLAACVALETCGLLLLSYATATGAGTLIRGCALMLLWSGLAALTVTAHREGKRSGEYLLGEWSYPVAVFSVGMVIVAAVGTIEFSFFR